jgi:hypothetical protein
MHLNHNFRIGYPALFEASTDEQLHRQTNKLGFYSTVLFLPKKTA